MRSSSIATIAVAFLGLAPATTMAQDPTVRVDTAPRPATKGWIWFEDQTAEHPPTLVLTLPGGEVRRCAASADTTLIAYLADRAWGGLPQLSIDTIDQNRVLLAFELGGVQTIEAAHLELWLHQSSLPTDGALALAVHPLLEGFAEPTTTWSSAPRFDAECSVRGDVGPAEGRVTLDVTELAKSATNDATRPLGLLLKAAAPVAAPTQPANPEAQVVERELREMFTWASDLDTALARADEDNRGVLALLVADYGNGGFTEHERLLLATCLVHPAVRAAIDAHWVPVVLRVSPNVASYAAEKRGQPGDPLAPIGLDVGDVRPPALIALDRRGKLRGKLTEISAFDHVEVVALLGASEHTSTSERIGTEEVARAVALVRKGELGAAAAALGALSMEPEARYWHAALAAARGERSSAERELRAIEEDTRASPWALKARARRVLPDVVEGFEVLTPTTRASTSAARIRAAVDELCRRQLPDGSFPMGTTPYGPHRLGVTVLATHALALHGRTVAEERARQWIVAQLATIAPTSLDSFAAAYWLDYVVARATRDQSTSSAVPAAIDLLIAGQLANGAWSYNKDFGDDWQGGFGGWPVTEKGRAHSMNTAQALDSLLRARAAGHAVDEGALERGRDALLAMRVAPARFTYTWPVPQCFEALDANIARAPLAEAVLRRFEANEPEDLVLALSTFEAGLGHLRAPGKLTDSWLPPHGVSAYFRAYAWHHAALAAGVQGGTTSKKLQKRIREEILAACEPDGTWLDSFTFGKAHGTAAALLALAATE
jgi:hypothetical protein